MKKTFPRVKTDEEIEALLEDDLSEYLHSGNFQPVTFEFQPKNKSVNVRISEEMLEAVKKISKKEGIPYQRYIRRAIERSLGAE
ncbi:CopG family transcriptional regulator [Anabaena cylindrica FACHB-243]|uniref:CopG-like domain-containing protein DNA-binding n=1 Tax=Anabaena cylindrica (strain ATCC 27899 / PCC 7122) TaxID=272123 RepID=K9ZGP2_ANACC|nr:MULTISPECIES: CopG family antitoxin [Anabaena]AFZ57535.1 CopG-like domain-containing protein DNA-binding [Anabaena cylindrica PCC 7122]MBD2418472.1 CopG family transcriptional regulator [Anabaena cylindrica FACHB-243]MBY5283683.1 CopG family transcriptional regulator [Anabaena sp. CCAP 1446/1C]MBY5308459.1 CopG family transcriptional regulator [Anabaena sp. CCAP 1446/1C]MCM2405101.1 CopG family antitoxin [Anabaena sp. CCAP 1446/1C]